MKTSWFWFCIISWLFVGRLSAQTTFVDPIYAVAKTDSDLVYGSAIDYKGCLQSLHLDLYKPLGAPAALRPLMVLVHGGSFISGTKADPTITALANEFASRGYVVAAIQYRLGAHLRSYVPTPYNLGDPNITCAYMNNGEVERAAYRGMQDVKGAIRFLKTRAAQDSVDTDWVFVGGESAGAIISNLVGFLDDPAERPSFCDSISSAPTPAANLPCTYNACVTDSKLRPDLGDIEGTLHLGVGVDADVRGVVSLYGGMFSNLFTLNHTPPCRFYAYHQLCDPIIASDSGGVYRYLDACLYYCSSYTPFQLGVGPEVKGTTAMVSYANSSGWGGTLKVDLVQTVAPPVPCGTCVLALVNPYYSSCHALPNVASEADSIAHFLQPCLTVGVQRPRPNLRFTVFPNPAHETVFFESPVALVDATFEIFTMQGMALELNATAITNQKFRMNLKGLAAGLYMVRMVSAAGVSTRLLTVE